MLIHSAAGSLEFRGILITDPGQMMKHVTNEINPSDIQPFEGFGRALWFSPDRAEKSSDLWAHLKQHSGPQGAGKGLQEHRIPRTSTYSLLPLLDAVPLEREHYLKYPSTFRPFFMDLHPSKYRVAGLLVFFF